MRKLYWILTKQVENQSFSSKNCSMRKRKFHYCSKSNVGVRKEVMEVCVNFFNQKMYAGNQNRIHILPACTKAIGPKARADSISTCTNLHPTSGTLHVNSKAYIYMQYLMYCSLHTRVYGWETLIYRNHPSIMLPFSSKISTSKVGEALYLSMWEITVCKVNFCVRGDQITGK